MRHYPEFDLQTVRAASLGGAVMAGGEGGSLGYGQRLGMAALHMGRLRMVELEDLGDDEMLICVSLVGSPAAKNRYLEPVYHVRAVEHFIRYTGMRIGGIITNGYGATSSLNGWVQSVALGIPLVDALCNGRNSPASVYGSMGLHLIENYESIQVGIGGDPALGNYVEVFTRGTFTNTTHIVRQAAVKAGGGIAIARNPVTVAYAKENAAANGVSNAITLGREMMRHEGNLEGTVRSICNHLRGEVVAGGRVSKFNFHTSAALDCGFVSIVDAGQPYTINFINQYMSLEQGGLQLATFPDLIIVLDKNTCMPVSSSDLKEDQDVMVIIVPKENLTMGNPIDVEAVYEQLARLTSDNRENGNVF